MTPSRAPVPNQGQARDTGRLHISLVSQATQVQGVWIVRKSRLGHAR